jgi:hypothetical protein
MDEIADPELAITRMVDTYRRKGYNDEWINQRILSIRTRNNLTAEWDARGVQGKEFGILTDEMTKEWSGMTTKEYKKHKDLKNESLRDNMSDMELILNMLGEASATEISKERKPRGLDENKRVARAGGEVAREARIAVEKRTKKSVVTKRNAYDFLQSAPKSPATQNIDTSQAKRSKA